VFTNFHVSKLILFAFRNRSKFSTDYSKIAVTVFLFSQIVQNTIEIIQKRLTIIVKHIWF